ncbi:phosphoenolpyruvate synthase [Cecembia calidifontis]|jgi:pyruvate,water dikinase|uniref:Phosphoenolpyruvate synthase n=1 Tax=Cecembia calidifontis TaxID=1187080 RepID=A0A4Q7PEY0_9BACT|nr:phosphoenolpyruvate synthase [Cecembia calidifontis]RZS98220.1 phosphoenolpyruvate synthase [Cecembia calidifontis]
MSQFVIPFSKIKNRDIAKVGGKNASLGEMMAELSSLGINIPDGFATTAEAFRVFLKDNQLENVLKDTLAQLHSKDLSNLAEIGMKCRELVSKGKFNEDLKKEFLKAYEALGHGSPISVAVRSSATAEDLPTASFAGQHDSFLNIEGADQLLEAIHKCYVSLFNDRAIKYREDNGFEHMHVALSVGVQKMVRSDLGSAGVAFTIDPESGFGNFIYITSAWGLGENLVQGAVNPDEFYAFKPSIEKGIQSVIYKKLGAKENKMVYSKGTERPVKNIKTSTAERNSFSLDLEEVELLADWCLKIEKHYGLPMDIEWAKDGQSGEIFIVQARPETVHGAKEGVKIKEYKIIGKKSAPIVKGKSVGSSIASGRVCIVHSIADAGKVKQGDIIVADITNPDWNAMLRKAVSIVTNKGGRTSHASIVARELGINAIVGTGDATAKLKDGQEITVSCLEGDEGSVYDGILDWTVKEIDLGQLPATKTKPMFILADPFNAFRLSFYPNQGVGLLRMEFIISNSIRIHPMALVKFEELPESNDKKAIEAITQHYADKRKYFVEKLSENIAMVAAAFYPKEVIVRMSDFKTNEYAQLMGGKGFEPGEENPMLGFRGASRYYHPLYKEGFGLECEAMRVVRDEMGLTNVKLMIPFCRTVEEGKKVLDVMKTFGLERGKNGLEVYVMAEIPSNVILAEEFAEIFDGFSIGSNDLTQLTLGIDRDSAIVSDLFDENNKAVKAMLSSVIQTARKTGKKIGLCGQAPSDYPAFAQFLVDEGIDSISFNPDALLKGIENIIVAESKKH